MSVSALFWASVVSNATTLCYTQSSYLTYGVYLNEFNWISHEVRQLRIRFWGVRGTIPTPGPGTVRFGGNTPCIDILTSDQQLIIIDAGTGITKLGAELSRLSPGQINATILLSHTHWDHIQGLPFFEPLHGRRNSFDLIGPRRTNLSLEEILARQFLEPYLPFAYRSLAAELNVIEKEPGDTIQIGRHTTIKIGAMTHPGGCVGYRIEDEQGVLAYCTDTAHPNGRLTESVMELAEGADLLIHDTHFRYESEAITYENWGHSCWEQAVRVAELAKVDMLALFHYAPELLDESVDEIAVTARQSFRRTIASREGLRLDLPLG
jgi:phosphoribosyl 1,2-cyclic phosphodiesterase